MLLDAVDEARTWKLSEAILWDPNTELVSAILILEERFGITDGNKERLNKGIPSLRWKHTDEERKTIFHFSEFYTWS